MPAPGNGPAPPHLLQAHLLFPFISLGLGFLAVVPGFDICFCSPWVWQLIAFPLQLWGPWFSLTAVCSISASGVCPPSALSEDHPPLAWALRWKWSSAVILARGLRRPRSTLDHSSSPLEREKRDAQLRLGKALTTVFTSGDLTPMSNSRRAGLKAYNPNRPSLSR